MLPAAQRIVVHVSDVQAEARDVMLVELRAPDGGVVPPFEPGAHLEMELPNGLIRHYSLVNDCRERDRYVVAVGRAANGRGGSTFLHQSVHRGMRLSINAPRNNFALEPAADSFLFVAGGIGVTPMMSMITWCEANERPWRLVYASRNAQRAAFYETLRPYGSRVHFHFDDQTGTVLDVEPWMADTRPGEHVYCCGPQPLMEAVRDGAGPRDPATVHFEYFVAPVAPPAAAVDGTDGAAGSFRLELRKAGLSFDVPPEQSILDVLEEHGLALPYSCREGLCGTCQTDVVDGEIDHRDYVLSNDERAAGKTMMICVSRALSPTLVLDL